MHYYQRNIGDYARDTGHLSVLEHGLYALMLDWYYLNERPITDWDLKRISRGFHDEARTVLCEFFKETEDGWVHSYADRLIADYHAKAEQNRVNGRKGGRRKANANPMGSQMGSESNPERTLTNNQEPITNNQKIKSTVQPTAARFPEFWAVYPNKKGKQEAEKRWRRDGLDAIADQILSHVRLMTARDDGWQRGYAPMGSTYLNQARWTDEPTGPAIQRSAPGKQMTGLMALEEMKHGVVPQRGHNGHPEAGVLGFGTAASGGGFTGDGFGVAGSPRIALGSGNGHATDSRGVLDLGPDGYRLADSAEAD